MTADDVASIESLRFEQTGKALSVDIVTFQLGPRVVVRVGRVDRTNQPRRQTVGVLVAGKRLEWTGGYDAPKIEQNCFDHESDTIADSKSES